MRRREIGHAALRYSDIFEIYFKGICNLTTSGVHLAFTNPWPRIRDANAKSKTPLNRDANVGIGSLIRIDHANQVMRVGIVELIARPLVEHVRIEPVGSQQGNALLALAAFALQPRQL